MSWVVDVVDSKWCLHESDERDPDWSGERRLFSSINSSIGLKTILSKILLYIGNNIGDNFVEVACHLFYG